MSITVPATPVDVHLSATSEDHPIVVRAFARKRPAPRYTARMRLADSMESAAIMRARIAGLFDDMAVELASSDEPSGVIMTRYRLALMHAATSAVGATV